MTHIRPNAKIIRSTDSQLFPERQVAALGSDGNNDTTASVAEGALAETAFVDVARMAGRPHPRRVT